MNGLNVIIMGLRCEIVHTAGNKVCNEGHLAPVPLREARAEYLW
jgi:hypothetical protein